MTILNILSKAGYNKTSFKKYDGEIGLEIETETKSQSSYPDGFLVPDPNGRGVWTAPSLKFWDVHTDGSLRDFGLEYVLKQPLKFKKEIPEALDEFRDKTAKVKFIKDSITTSVHVHLNVLNESFKTLGNFFTLYSLFENLLIRYSGPDRLSNLFCLPICDAEDTYKNIVMMMQSVQAKNYKSIFMSESAVKYAALNLSAFNNYGSIEVRSFRGETDTKAIHNWVGILYSLMEHARKDINPKYIMLSWKEKQKKFLDEVFGNYRGELNHKDEISLVEKNVWYAGSIAYSIKNWESLDEVATPPDFKPKQKDLEAVSLSKFGTEWINLDHAQQDFVLKYLKDAHYKKFYGGPARFTDLEFNPTIAPVGGTGARTVTATDIINQFTTAPNTADVLEPGWRQIDDLVTAARNQMQERNRNSD